MSRPPSQATVLAALAWGLAAAAHAQAPPSPPETELGGPQVRSTILKGLGISRPAPPRAVQVLPSGDISLNFPGVDVQAVAKAVLGDTLGATYTLDPNLHAQVTVRTPHPIRRGDVIGVLEQALTDANLVLVSRPGGYAILAAAAARGQAPAVTAADSGFGNETIPLRFVNAEEMRKLLEPLIPGAVSASDPAQNVLVISGNGVQRKALRELVAEFDVDWLKGMSFALFVPQRTDARLIAPELEKLLNGAGAPTAGLVRLIAMDSLNGILAISAQPQYLEDTRRFVEILDREGEGAERRIFVYHVQNGRASDLAKVLNAAFGNGGVVGGDSNPDAPALTDHSAPSASTAPVNPLGGAGGPGARPGLGAAPRLHAPGGDTGGGAAALGDTTITADETNNAIVVFATPRNYALISSALAKLDVAPLQVMIDASIDEVTLNHQLQYGLQWSFTAGPSSGLLTQGTTSAPVQNFPGFSYVYQGANVNATFNALAQVTDVKVLSAPKLMVMNNRTATIEVGDQVPISTGSAVSTISSGAPIVNSIEYRDTGIILKITPRVNSGGLVLLDIAQEVSDVKSTSTSSISSPTITQRKIATSVAIQDGESIALGGLIKNSVSKGRSTIPGLGNIPVLGHLFGDTTGQLQRTELVVILTPHVVRAPVDARAVTREMIDKIHLGAPGPAHAKTR